MELSRLGKYYTNLNLTLCRGNYSATSNNMKLVHWPLVGGHLVQRGGDWTELQPAQFCPRCTKCNMQPTHQQPVYQQSYCLLLCGLIVALKGLKAFARLLLCSHKLVFLNRIEWNLKKCYRCSYKTFKTVQERPLLPTEVETWLPDCGVAH